MTSEAGMNGPLSGLKVIEMGQAIAAPMASAIMADLGADVIKIEKPEGGDDARSWGPPFFNDAGLTFHSMNRNKRSVTLDIKNPDDLARIKDIIRDADVFVQNLRGGVIEEAGLGPEVLTALNPRLVYCSVWAFGNKGPLKKAPGFDPLLQAYGGVMTLTGRATDPPTFCAPSINDKGTAMWSVIGILSALRERDRTGKGCVIDTSLFDTAVSWIDGQMQTYYATGNVPERTGAAGANLVPYQTFDTSDRPICIAAGNDRIFAKLAKVLGHPEWADDARFVRQRDRRANKDALISAMEEILKTRTRADWLADLQKAGVPAGPVNDVAELAATEQLALSELPKNLPRSDVKLIGLPISFNGKRPDLRLDAPLLGEHNGEILGHPLSGAAE